MVRGFGFECGNLHQVFLVYVYQGRCSIKMLSIDERKLKNFVMSSLLAPFLTLLKVARVTTAIPKEGTDHWILVRFVKDVIVGLDSPRRGAEFRPVDL